MECPLLLVALLFISAALARFLLPSGGHHRRDGMASRAAKQQPFAYVNAHPSLRTPAGQGGMLLGDAILRLGDACHLRDVQEVLHTNTQRRVPVHVIDAQGHFATRHIIPRVWDPSAPASLLGCQMSNVIPPSHPALTGAAPKGSRAAAAAAASGRAAVEPDGADWAVETQQKETVLMLDKSRGGPSTSCWPRLTLGEPRARSSNPGLTGQTDRPAR